MEIKLAIIGLGYVGLPLATAFAKKRKVCAFDIDAKRIDTLKKNYDYTAEVSSDQLEKVSENIVYSTEPSILAEPNCYVLTVPTPIYPNKTPDLRPLESATRMISKYLKKGDLVIYESTVYPGATEEICVPILEESGLAFNVDFFCGYSPERINPGDKKHTIEKIVKITSGSNQEASEIVDSLYREIIEAGTHKASSIKVAEAAKVIENAQRDLNIAFMNELSIIFSGLDIDTYSVLEAAKTKWNFLPFSPGMVGGHCIGVDPYYLTYKSQASGYTPEVILAGRKINDNMSKHFATKILKALVEKNGRNKNLKILILGISFKEDCPDIRNTKVVDMRNELISFGCDVDIYDPVVDKTEVALEYNFQLIDHLKKGEYDGIIIAVPHYSFLKMGFGKIESLGTANCVVLDIKNLFPNCNATLKI